MEVSCIIIVQNWLLTNTPTLAIGDYSVCVNAATMALIDAGIPMKDFVCACSASYIEDTPLLGIIIFFKVVAHEIKEIF